MRVSFFFSMLVISSPFLSMSQNTRPSGPLPASPAPAPTPSPGNLDFPDLRNRCETLRFFFFVVSCSLPVLDGGVAHCTLFVFFFFFPLFFPAGIFSESVPFPPAPRLFFSFCFFFLVTQFAPRPRFPAVFFFSSLLELSFYPFLTYHSFCFFFCTPPSSSGDSPLPLLVPPWKRTFFSKIIECFVWVGLCLEPPVRRTRSSDTLVSGSMLLSPPEFLRILDPLPPSLFLPGPLILPIFDVFWLLFFLFGFYFSGQFGSSFAPCIFFFSNPIWIFFPLCNLPPLFSPFPFIGTFLLSTSLQAALSLLVIVRPPLTFRSQWFTKNLNFFLVPIVPPAMPFEFLRSFLSFFKVF